MLAVSSPPSPMGPNPLIRPNIFVCSFFAGSVCHCHSLHVLVVAVALSTPWATIDQHVLSPSGSSNMLCFFRVLYNLAFSLQVRACRRFLQLFLVWNSFAASFNSELAKKRKKNVHNQAPKKNEQSSALQPQSPFRDLRFTGDHHKRVERHCIQNMLV